MCLKIYDENYLLWGAFDGEELKKFIKIQVNKKMSLKFMKKLKGLV